MGSGLQSFCSHSTKIRQGPAVYQLGIVRGLVKVTFQWEGQTINTSTRTCIPVM